MKRFAAIAGSALVGLMFATSANAANPEPVPVEVEWVAAIVVGPSTALQFGLLDVGTAASETVTIDTDNSYSESTANTVVGGTQLAATVTITVADTTPITIVADNHLGATYYTLDTWVCSYNLGADAPCVTATPYDVAASGTSADVKIGATLTVVGTPTPITDDSTFDLTVTYQ
jgi:hypothetical protein